MYLLVILINITNVLQFELYIYIYTHTPAPSRNHELQKSQLCTEFTRFNNSKIFKRITSVTLWKLTLCFTFCCLGRLQHSTYSQLQPSSPVAVSMSVVAKHVTSAYGSAYNAYFCPKISGILRALCCPDGLHPVESSFRLWLHLFFGMSTNLTTCIVNCSNQKQQKA